MLFWIIAISCSYTQQKTINYSFISKKLIIFLFFTYVWPVAATPWAIEVKKMLSGKFKISFFFSISFNWIHLFKLCTLVGWDCSFFTFDDKYIFDLKKNKRLFKTIHLIIWDQPWAFKYLNCSLAPMELIAQPVCQLVTVTHFSN